MVILASIHSHSSELGSTSKCSPILAIVTDTGIVVIGGSEVCPSTRVGFSSFISHFGTLQVRIAATEA